MQPRETHRFHLVTADGEQLEAELARPPGDVRPGAGMVLCHPHPQFGGTMRSLVISALFSALPDGGVECLRFNSRGVEGSSGSYGGGTAERLDAEAAVDALAGTCPGARWCYRMVVRSRRGCRLTTQGGGVVRDRAAAALRRGRPPVAPAIRTEGVVLAGNDNWSDTAAVGGEAGGGRHPSVGPPAPALLRRPDGRSVERPGDLVDDSSAPGRARPAGRSGSP